jgi:hypothetical protein
VPSKYAGIVLGSLGWSRLSPDAAREVEYRRSNRQIFLGLLPAVIVGWAAATMSVLGGHASWTAAPLVVLLAVIAYIGVGLSYVGAHYQEECIARQLVTAALLRGDADHESAPLLLRPPRAETLRARDNV